MFSKLWPEKLPSPWRLSLLMVLIVLVINLMILTFVRIAVTQDMRSVNRSRILDSLLQHAALYTEGGLPMLKKVSKAGQPLSRNGLRVVGATGVVVYEDIPEPLRPYPWPTQPLRTLVGKGDMDQQEITADGQPFLLYVGAIRLWDGSTLWLGRTDAQSRHYLGNIERHLWFAGLTASLMAFLPVMWYLHDVLRPIQSFIISAERMRLPGSTTRLRAPGAIPELKVLASVVNTGLDQIQALTRELQSTNDFLAHELRTPLARIRGNLEHLHDETDNDKAREAAARGLEEIDRATQLVQTLLTIRAGDHAALRLHRQITSLDSLLSNLVELFIPAAEDRRLVLKLVPGLSLTLNMDRELLTQAVSNLLDNALAYTPAGGQITVRWQGEGTGALITVDDTGPGLHPGEVEVIWERYARGTAARPKTSGMGLGLSLVRSIAMAHGGYAGAQNREGGGSTFWIHIPGA
ncbi:signal transduction histidine kinase [Prosthecobacter fusiformis]|uniref:histidine kinase n=1 Tax=Prosthecobacter fusiformis TaxID=48464 RepID=A0A4R7RT52_9BACT|nr:HAMP domain-containing sensor histidine kinase [Prosthecobacter fusiformis]TDU68148.1 signal transduction histidine kinase [Prosthecobacter fusiformis]